MKCHVFKTTFFPILLCGFVAALLPLSHCVGWTSRGPRASSCRTNLQQLYKLATVYASTHKGEWPSGTGEELWLALSRTTPPLVDPTEMEVFHCPLREDVSSPGECDYRGPRVPWKQFAPTDPIAADKEGNHGEGQPIHVLLNDGSVLEVEPRDPLYKKCREMLRP